MADRTWQYDNNRTVADTTVAARMNYSWLWYLKAFLTGQAGGATLGLWTVDQSCAYVGGTTWTASSGDNYSSTFVLAEWLQAASGNHSWIVLKSPASFANGPWYLTIDLLSTAGTALPTNGFRFSKTQPTGGSTSASPTTSNYIYSNYLGNTMDYSTTGVLYRINGMLASNGDFVVIVVKANTGLPQTFTAAFHLLETDASDTAPMCFMHQWLQSGNCMTATYFSEHSTANNQWHIMAPIIGPSGSTTVGGGALVVGTIQSGGFGFRQVLTYGDAISYKHPTFPMYIWNATSGYLCVRGRLPDFQWILSALPQGAVYPGNGSITYVKLGDVYFPANAAPLL